jgi:hypothetical protein
MKFCNTNNSIKNLGINETFISETPLPAACGDTMRTKIAANMMKVTVNAIHIKKL